MLPVTHKYTVNKSYQTVLFLHKTFNNSLLFIGKSVA